MSLLNHPKKALKLKPSIPVKRSEPWKEIENIAKKNIRWNFIFYKRPYIFNYRRFNIISWNHKIKYTL